MNKYYLDVITGGDSKGGIVNYIVEADGFIVDSSYIFYTGERRSPILVARFPIERTIIGNIETPIQDEKTK
jgi:hypothetical protein